MKKTSIVCLLLLSLFQVSLAQDKKKTAYENAVKAVKLMDEGKIDESIQLLEESRKLDPDRFDYPYELAFAYYLKKEYKKSIKILEKVKDHKDVTPLLYQLLGNSYDMSGDAGKAMKTYDDGIALFPQSGNLHLEKGNIFLVKEEYNEAINNYRNGISADPMFPSNYYRAALLYCNSTEPVWGLIYGEIFMNLERNSARTAEISKLLFDTYQKNIKIENDTSMSVSFCKNMTMNLNDTEKLKLPFCMIFEPTIILSVIGKSEIDIHSLNDIRSTFSTNYYSMKHNESYPNVLYDYQQKIIKAGHFESYNYWILMKGDEEKFSVWHEENPDKWKEFVTWFTENPIRITRENKFLND